jgi:hypothetical protein
MIIWWSYSGPGRVNNKGIPRHALITFKGSFAYYGIGKPPRVILAGAGGGFAVR